MVPKMLKMSAVDLSGKRVLVREDFNVPIHDGVVTSDARIKAALPTIRQILEAGGKLILMSHLGRPEEGRFDPTLSMVPVARRLSELLSMPVRLAANWLDGVEVKPGEIVLTENVRFNIGEEVNDVALSKRMAALCDVFVMDAFGTAHRAQASTYGVAQFAPIACAGPLLNAEITALNKALKKPHKPLVAIVGGSKISTKLSILHSLIEKVNTLIVGGGIANTFLAAQGFNVGKSLCEHTMMAEVAAILAKASQRQVDIMLPLDAVVATEFSASAQTQIKPIDQIAENDLILDVGPRTAAWYRKCLQQAGTILWNGPVGAFEMKPFSEGTRALSLAIADSLAFSLAGGGDTLAAIEAFGVESAIDYISTGGGAFLEYIEGKKLPSIQILKERSLN